MGTCVFCQIVEGAAPASVVYADATLIAIMDIQPINPGHVLVIPRHHAGLLSELVPGEGVACFAVAENIAKALRESGLRCEGVNLFVADGEAAFQDVPHFHIHVIPRFVGDGFSLTFPPTYGEPVERTALDDSAARIRTALS